MQIFRLEAMTQHLFTEPERDLGWRIQAVSSSFHWHVKRRRGRMIYLPCGLDTIATDRVINTSADDLIGSDSGLAFSWKDMELSPGERITRSVLFSVGEIADPPVLSKDPFSFTLEAEGKKSIKVDARVTDKAGRTDSIYYTIKKDGQPQQEERNLASVLADGSEKTITGVIGEAEFPDDGTYIVNVWIMRALSARL